MTLAKWKRVIQIDRDIGEQEECGLDCLCVPWLFDGFGCVDPLLRWVHAPFTWYS